MPGTDAFNIFLVEYSLYFEFKNYHKWKHFHVPMKVFGLMPSLQVCDLRVILFKVNMWIQYFVMTEIH